MNASDIVRAEGNLTAEDQRSMVNTKFLGWKANLSESQQDFRKDGVLLLNRWIAESRATYLMHSIAWYVVSRLSLAFIGFGSLST